jgi:hypothetical protein
MDDQFHTGRKRMINAFVELSTLALRAGVKPDDITELHGCFFDGNVEIKDAFAVTGFKAWLGNARTFRGRR